MGRVNVLIERDAFLDSVRVKSKVPELKELFVRGLYGLLGSLHEWKDRNLFSE